MKVDFWRNDFDMEVLTYARMGLATRAIAEMTGLSEPQVVYRLGEGHCIGVRAEYRNGRSAEFKIVRDIAKERVQARTQRELKKHVPGPRDAFRHPKITLVKKAA